MHTEFWLGSLPCRRDRSEDTDINR